MFLQPLHRRHTMLFMSDRPSQYPRPGSHCVFYRGDVLSFRLAVPGSGAGKAWVRTNAGGARRRRREAIELVERESPVLGRDWHDVPMRRTGDGFSLVMPLTEVGCFGAKAFFLPAGGADPLWPDGENVRIKVEPAGCCCANSIYSAFVRQFGPRRERVEAAEERDRAVSMLDKLGYTVIPRSGKFRDLVKELDFIIGKLGCRIVQLLPIHPTPTTYARMGRFGSPFAALHFKEIDPALAEFDRRTTPLDQFRELADEIHGRCGKLFIDIPVNHTGWASHLQIEHPGWFAHDADRSFRSPGAWGVTWEDLSQLDYGNKDLWKYMAEVFLYWCRQGVDGFRCDAGYMVPYPVWEYITARVRDEYPDTVFMLEGLGGKAEVVESLLAGAGMNWAYSELFQNYDRRQIEWYLPRAAEVSRTKGMLVHFAETHDNNRLAARSRVYAKMRTALSALCSECGGFGITNGVEWFAERKIDVHNADPINWGSEENQVEHIARLNAILEAHPCFHPGTTLRMVQCGEGNVIALLRERPDTGKKALVLVNLGDAEQSRVSWSPGDFAFAEGAVDLVSGRNAALEEREGTVSRLLAPGEALCVAPDPGDLEIVAGAASRIREEPARGTDQELRAKALEVYCFHRGCSDVSSLDIAGMARRLKADPFAYCGEVQGGSARGYPMVVSWKWPRDAKRTVMAPPDHFLCIECPHRFVAELRDAKKTLRREQCLPRDGGGFFALMAPLEAPAAHTEYSMHMTVHEPGNCRRISSPVLFLCRWRKAVAAGTVRGKDAVAADCCGLCVNGRGGMSQARAAWGSVFSQYDALLAANLDPDHPVDRHVMLTACRGWLVNRGYSVPLDGDCLDFFNVSKDGALGWRFTVPAGHGKLVVLDVQMRMLGGRNAVEFEFRRGKLKGGGDSLGNAIPVKIILRPDIEDRVNHWKTKAFAGPEHEFPRAVRASEDGFVFAPSRSRELHVRASPGAFTPEPEWRYMVGHPIDAGRGQDGCSDLFSPGYFTLTLNGGRAAILRAEILPDTGRPKREDAPAVFARLRPEGGIPLETALLRAMRQFLVKRDAFLTVIAGYPWFLDWGRDTLICLRGLIAAGMTAEAERILSQFARFERRGSIPNMLRGGDSSDRDTSDAPLWFIVACADLVGKRGSGKFLVSDAGGRSMRDVLISIATSFVEGTPNGIAADPESGLVFSPSHFTWMDTNFPAGTPREGYPIEIQALWYAALRFVATIDPGGRWADLSRRVRESVLELYLLEDGYLSDCLHGGRGCSARDAVPDDALRCNQLFAITLGLIENREIASRVLSSCAELLVPGAIRTLADRPVKVPLPVLREGTTLNDPLNPYWGRYEGDEDARRKPAYHNGTAWTWPFPSYCEAMYLVHGRGGKDTALSLLSSASELLARGCVGQIPEIVDGDAPHEQRGCAAQAWGVTELYRVLALLTAG